MATTANSTPPPTEPGGGSSMFPAHRVVAFYGEAGNPGLGVLGDAPPDQLWDRLAAQAAPYASPGVQVTPAYELIAYTAEADAGPAGTYTARTDDSVIAQYLSVVQTHHGLLILDIQPGRGSVLAEAETLGSWLDQPDVGLALDPEWELQPGQSPLQQIGHTTAAEVNAVSAWLSELVQEHHLPQKLLLVHQFTPDMVEDKAAVLPRPSLAITFNMDGYGGRADKMAEYAMLASNPRFALGFKVFYQRDADMLSPADVLALTPPPDVVEYE